ncbi:thiamine phosphate synthase [Neoaquamicrobium sediminum]|uniref:thiamine phosphate synthase n=1 Tax=Neoaquamicrobium sediminum TaxID=1849104 RepID=UPI001565369E|nr:thiamine phosphate synthase [Mesorhizobium sediminum]NRC56732.1 thiamine phosphate synthase [Mesorhizobium sediminum]
MNPTEAPSRCRIVLIAPPQIEAGRLIAALDGGDVASLILPGWEMDDDAFQLYAERVVPAAQEHGVAVVIGESSRVAMRTGADGLHVETDRRELEEIIAKHQAKLMIGTGGATNRDDALELGEARPDYLFFGRFGYDNKPEPHPRNLKLGQWWAEMVQVPCIVAGGVELDSALTVAATGVEFVALSEAIFSGDRDPDESVATVNAALDAQAPQLEG